jgi:hypothetical protein
MKKLYLSLLTAILFTHFSYAQIDATINTTSIGLGATTTDPDYKFTYQGNSIAHYGLSWFNDPDFVGGPMGYLGGYGGLKLFTGGVPRLVITNTGNIGIGTSSPSNKLDIYSNNERMFIGNGPIGLAIGQWDNTNNRIESVGRPLYFTTYTGAINFGISGITNLTIANSGNVGIGITNPQNKLDVNGTVHSKQVNVDMNGWSDYVFNKDYILMPLSKLKTYIDQNHHLPEIPSEQEVAEKGLNLGEMNKLLTKKVEELTLYLIEKDKEVKDQQEEIQQNQFTNQVQQKEIEQLKQSLEALTKEIHKN